MELKTEILTKGLLGLVAAILAWAAARPWRRRGVPPPRAASPVLGVLAAVAALAYVNFTFFHGAGFVHQWEQFHYVLGSKYFPEVGYDGLYAASVAAQKETLGNVSSQPNLRDLRSNDVVPTDTLSWPILEVRRRFAPERWRAFVEDHAHLLRAVDLSYLYKVRTDHGFNPTPAWTFTARLVTAWLPVNATTQRLFGAVDIVLLAVTFTLVFRTFGSRVGALALTIFGLGYAWRWDWNGGAFLRDDWLLATVAGVCFLERRKPVAAGAAFAYGTAVRIFPALFLFGPALLAVRSFWRRDGERGFFVRVFAGFGLGLVLLAGAGSLTGRGTAAWPEFAANFAKHRKTWLTNNVGLANLFLYERETVERSLVDWSAPEPWRAWQRLMDERTESRKAAIRLGQAAFLALLAAAAWRMRVADSALLGMGAVYALGLLTGYYWAMLLLVPVRRGTRATEGVLLMGAALFALHTATPAFEAIYGAMSVFLLVLLAGLAIGVMASSRRLPDPSPVPRSDPPADTPPAGRRS